MSAGHSAPIRLCGLSKGNALCNIHNIERGCPKLLVSFPCFHMRRKADTAPTRALAGSLSQVLCVTHRATEGGGCDHCLAFSAERRTMRLQTSAPLAVSGADCESGRGGSPPCLVSIFWACPGDGSCCSPRLAAISSIEHCRCRIESTQHIRKTPCVSKPQLHGDQHCL